MNANSDNASWILAAGDAVIAKKAGIDPTVLSAVERLVYCLWVADYGMRNAGDFDTARDLYPDFQREAVGLASDLGLRFTRDSFALPSETLQVEYFERFNRICDEIKGA
jgi:hypothetical protein